jgi:hypothetical protein
MTMEVTYPHRCAACLPLVAAPQPSRVSTSCRRTTDFAVLFLFELMNSAGLRPSHGSLCSFAHAGHLPTEDRRGLLLAPHLLDRLAGLHALARA